MVAVIVTDFSSTPTLTLPPPWFWLSGWTFFTGDGFADAAVTAQGGSVVVVVVVVVLVDVVDGAMVVVGVVAATTSTRT